MDRRAASSPRELPAEPGAFPARAVVVVAIALWAVCAWLLGRPESIVDDWTGWRQADTQAIARNLTEPGSSVVYPRIDWRGAGTGYVETEFQLYAGIVAVLLGIFGEAEWPGQLVSLLSACTAAWAVFQLLSERYGEPRAVFGTFAFLAAPSVLYTATAVQPEAFCLALFVLAWGRFLAFEKAGRGRDLVLFAALGALAMLVKPTAAQIGIGSGVVLLVSSRHHLRSARIWIAWAGMALLLVLYLLHARELYLEHHNTFGVLSGGDSKAPKLRHLLQPGSWFRALRTQVLWGLGTIGSVSVVALVVRRRIDAAVWGLAAAALVWTMVSFRYVCNVSWGGSHYTIVTAVLAAHAASAAFPERLAASVATRWRAAALALALVATALSFRERRRDLVPGPEARMVKAVGAVLARVSTPDELVVVRSSRWLRDDFWSSGNNYEDPRVFYVARRRGWVVAKDEVDPGVLALRAREGAKLYVEPGPGLAFVAESQDEWLSAHADLVGKSDLGGRVFRFRTPPAP